MSDLPSPPDLPTQPASEEFDALETNAEVNGNVLPVWKKEVKWDSMINYPLADIDAKNYCSKANIAEMKNEFPMVLMAMCIGIPQIEGAQNENPGTIIVLLMC